MAQEITAVVPTFNRAAMIGEALESIMAQKRAVSEIIVWDVGSNDDTPTRIAEIAARHPDLIRYERAESEGKSHALNMALEIARGDYIWIFDDEDVALPDATLRLSEPLDTNPNLGLVAGKNLQFSTPDELPRAVETRKQNDAIYWPDLRSGSVLRHTLEAIFFSLNGALVRNDCYKRTGPFSTDIGPLSDYEMTVRLLARYPAEILDDPVVLQRSKQSGSARIQSKHTEEERFHANRDIFRRLRPMLPLSLYRGMFEGHATLEERAARLQRGAVYARCGDWDLALVDFEEAAHIAPSTALADEEVRILSRAMAGNLGGAETLNKRHRRRILNFARTSVAGQGIARAISRGAVSHLREAAQNRRFGDALEIALFSLRMPPLPQAAGAKAEQPVLAERQKLPMESYAW